MSKRYLEDSADESTSTSAYRISKKIFWPVLAGTAAIVIVLLVLTIYFGVNQKRSSNVDNEIRTTLTSTSFGTTTTTSSPPVVRIPTSLQQQLYQLTIEPNLDHESFTGKLFFTFKCIEPTNQLFLHLINLNLTTSSIKIVNSTSGSTPIFVSLVYDSYNEFAIMNFSSNFQLEYTYTISIVYTGVINRDLNGLYLSDYIDANGQDRVFMTSQMEPTHARRVLPCIDEPARKASFQISIQHDSTYTVWSNAEVERVDTLKDGQLVSHFHRTLNMSTFLLAMIMAPSSDFSCR
ncbi:unnamed protein product, partial [Adineta ricciae]